MDKKTVISERPDTQEKTTVKESQKPEETQLQVGQSVVLMDSNLRGRIIRLGRTVTIELEDGLVIESAYGEFAVTDKTEIESLKQTSQTNPDGSLTIDLHIEAIPGGRNIPKGQQLQSERNWTKSLLSDAATQLVTRRSQLSI